MCGKYLICINLLDFSKSSKWRIGSILFGNYLVSSPTMIIGYIVHYYIAAAAAKLLQSCPTLCDPIDGSPPGSTVPGILSPGKNTGVSCHSLLPCVKVKSEREAAQSCPTLSHPMDCSLPGSFVHGIFQARVLEWGAIAFSEGQTGLQ